MHNESLGMPLTKTDFLILNFNEILLTLRWIYTATVTSTNKLSSAKASFDAVIIRTLNFFLLVVFTSSRAWSSTRNEFLELFTKES